MNDLISVIIPVYLAEKTLQKCVVSVQKQTYRKLEIILIDDGSFDLSAEICDRLIACDIRITVVHISNGGAGNARNLGIELSFGGFLAFFDSDDYAELEMLNDLIATINNDESDCAVSAVNNKVVLHNSVISFTDDSQNEFLYSLFKNNVLYAPWAKLYRSSTIKNNHITFPTDLNFGEDMVFNIRHMYHINTISYINKNYYHYIRDNQDSLSQKVRWNMFDNDMIFEKQLQDLFFKKKLFCDKVMEYAAFRILGVAYDSLFLLTRKDCSFSRREKVRYIKKIINEELVQWSLSIVDTSKYAQWMINPMKQKNAWVIFLLCNLKRIV